MFSYLLRCVYAVLLVLGCTSAVHAGAIDNITVGQAGLAGNCTVATIQAAINLAAQHPGPDTIWVSRDTPDGYYLATSALSISNQDVEIIGGFDDCFDETPSGFTDISGNGNAADPVFRIRGSGGVRLQNLTITLGDADNNEGAGIDYQGNGVLEVLNTILNFNHAQGNGAGGGIRFSGTNAGGDLVISNSFIHDNSANHGGGVAFGGTGRLIVNNSAINSNTARGSGGGVYLKSAGGSINAYLEHGASISGNAAADDGGAVYAATNVSLEWNGPDGEMWLNTAGDMGGGFYLYDRVSLDFFSRGRLFPPSGQYHAVISGNSARHGGALATIGGFGGTAPNSIRFSSYDNSGPQVIGGNQASELGGAIYMQAYADNDNAGFSRICMSDTTIVGNTAQRGAVAYSKNYTYGGESLGNRLYINSDVCGFATGRAPCVGGLECTSISNNHASLGAVFDFEPGIVNQLVLSRGKFVGNSGSHLVYFGGGSFGVGVDSDPSLRIRNSLVVLNNFATGIVRAPNTETVAIHNTIADNTIAESSMNTSAIDTFVTGQFEVSRNIIIQPG
jgi:predicted outer membrane repeat protein